MYVGQVMTHKVVTASPGEVVGKTFKTMLAKRIAHLPVVDGKTLVGIISDRDLRKAIIKTNNRRRGVNPLEFAVADIMTRDVVTVDTRTHVMDAVNLMIRMGIGSLPVVESGKLKGIITKDDLLNIFVEMLRMIQSSSTIDVELVDEIEDVAAVFSVLRKHKASVLSYSATPGSDNVRQVCHFRLKFCPVKPIVLDLKKKKVKVLDAYGDD